MLQIQARSLRAVAVGAAALAISLAGAASAQAAGGGKPTLTDASVMYSPGCTSPGSASLSGTVDRHGSATTGTLHLVVDGSTRAYPVSFASDDPTQPTAVSATTPQIPEPSSATVTLTNADGTTTASVPIKAGPSPPCPPPPPPTPTNATVDYEPGCDGADSGNATLSGSVERKNQATTGVLHLLIDGSTKDVPVQFDADDGSQPTPVHATAFSVAQPSSATLELTGAYGTSTSAVPIRVDPPPPCPYRPPPTLTDASVVHTSGCSDADPGRVDLSGTVDRHGSATTGTLRLLTGGVTQDVPVSFASDDLTQPTSISAQSPPGAEPSSATVLLRSGTSETDATVPVTEGPLPPCAPPAPRLASSGDAAVAFAPNCSGTGTVSLSGTVDRQGSATSAVLELHVDGGLRDILAGFAGDDLDEPTGVGAPPQSTDLPDGATLVLTNAAGESRITLPVTVGPVPPCAPSLPPRLTSVRVGRHHGRSVLTLTLSEPATLSIRTQRVVAGSAVHTVSSSRRAGAGTVRLRLPARRPGRYRVRVLATDGAGLTGPPRRARFRIR